MVNNFDELFANYPTITRVYFNGAKAAAHVMKPGAKLAAWQAISPS